MTTDQLFDQAKSNLSKLPPICFIAGRSPDTVLGITRGQKGYVPLESEFTAEQLNHDNKVSHAEVAAMMKGAQLGFHSPFADPDKYDEEGELK